MNKYRSGAFIGFITAVFLSLVACKEEVIAPSLPAVKIKIVHSPEITDYLQAVKSQFVASGQALSDGAKIEPELVSENLVTASKKIARGEIKAEGWVSASKLLVDLTNNSIRNLGAPQVDCKTLFGTPVVVAVQPRFSNLFNDERQVFSWSNFFDALYSQVSKEKPLETIFSYGYGSIDRTTSGFASFLQLAYLAAVKGNSQLTMDGLESNSFVQQFEKLMSPVSFYSQDETTLLDRSVTSLSTRAIFALTTEQQLIEFNRKKSDAQPKLLALYPKEGSFWLDYSICNSKADWVTEQQQAAMLIWSNYLQSNASQGEAFRRGFRPLNVKVEKAQDPFTDRYGVKFEIPEMLQDLPKTDALNYLLDNWQKYSRPVSRTFVLDTSGTTAGLGISTGLKLARTMFAAAKPRDKSALITFADKVIVAATPTNEHAKVIRAMEGLQGSGGSSIYDALVEALTINTQEDLRSYRKTIYLYTDGKDNHSTTSLSDLIDLWKDRKRSFDITLEIIAVESLDVDYSDLKSIAAVADGHFRKILPADIEKVITEIMQAP